MSGNCVLALVVCCLFVAGAQALKCKVGMQHDLFNMMATMKCLHEEHVCGKIEIAAESNYFALTGLETKQSFGYFACLPQEFCSALNDTCLYANNMEDIDVMGIKMELSDCRAQCCESDLCNASTLGSSKRGGLFNLNKVLQGFPKGEL